MSIPDSGTANPKTADVLAGQISQSYNQLPISLAVSVVNGLLLTVVLWGAVGTHALLAWLLVLFSVTAGRYAILRGYRDPLRRARISDAIWERTFVLGACASGVVWGAAGVILFHPQSLAHQVFLAFVLGGMVAGAMPLLSPLNNAYPCYAIPAVLPIGFAMLAQGDRIHLIMGLMILVFGLAMGASSLQVHRLFRTSIELRLRLLSSIEASHALRQMVHVDDLTGVANRRLFEESLEREWLRAQRDGAALSVVTADIDHFKAYNDYYGHPGGDRCLIGVARAMASALHRPADVAARIGGEEFAFLLPDTALEGAATIAQRIHQSVIDLDLPHQASPVADQVTVSVGVAAAEPGTGASTSDLLRTADAALYEAKHRGRNQVVWLPMTGSPPKGEGAP